MSADFDSTDVHALSALLHIEQSALTAATPAALGFTIVNETLALVQYRQAAFFTHSLNGKLRLTTASGLVSVAEDSPYAVWLTRFAQTLPLLPACGQVRLRKRIAQIHGWLGGVVARALACSNAA